jgi:hypothetical protein
MRIVSEYGRHAEECCKLAKSAANLKDRKVFEGMAQNWDLLAHLRIGDLELEDQRTSGTNRFRSIT